MEKEQLLLIEELSQYMQKESGEQKTHYQNAKIIIDAGSIHQWMLKLVGKSLGKTGCLYSFKVFPPNKLVINYNEKSKC